MDFLNGYIYPDSDLSQFAKSEYDIVFMGHTHRSFIRDIKEKKIINTGSCGFSRDAGNKISAVLFDTHSGEVHIKDFVIDKNLFSETFGKHIHPSVLAVINRNNIYVE